MKKLLFFSLTLFFSFGIAQNDKSLTITKTIDDKIQQAKILASSDPTEATKKLLELKEHSEKIHYNTGAMYSSMGLLLLYYNGGDYKQAIAESRVIEKYAKELQHFEYISDVYRMRGLTYSSMGLLKECLNELQESLLYADKIEADHIRAYKKALIYEGYAGIYDENVKTYKQELFYRQKSIAETKKMPEKNLLVLNAKYQNLALQYASIGLIYSNIKIVDSANYYFEKALEIHENENYDIYINGRAMLLSDMAKFYTENKNYAKAISFGKRAEKLEKQAPMPYFRKEIYHSLFNSYVETHKQDSAKYYLKSYSVLNDSLMKSQKEDILTPVNQILSDNEAHNNNTIQKVILIAIAAFVVLAAIGLVFWNRKNKKVRQKYDELISTISIEDQKQVVEIHGAKETEDPKPSMAITDDTLKNLLHKIEKFEKSDKYLKNEVSLTYLANSIGTNTKYLSETIKLHKGKSFNNYINGLRIAFIVKQLYTNPKFREYKISYLAELSGFSSREVFAVVFKKETGITPSFFINSLQKDENVNQDTV